MNLYDDNLKRIYEKLGFVSSDGCYRPLHRSCGHCEICWQGIQNRTPIEDNDNSSISHPWVGNRYNELRLLVIGVNLNEAGGRSAIINLTEEAKQQIIEGYRRVRFKNKYSFYPGSMLWHRMGCYATIIAESKQIFAPVWLDDGYPSKEFAANSYDLFSFTEHIKCSPDGDNSRPTLSMWETCSSQVLNKEIRLLDPDLFLILGSSMNQFYFGKNILDCGYLQENEYGQVKVASGQIKGKNVIIYTVPHPSSYGGNKKSILQDLRKAVNMGIMVS